jgi:hypothetical protein
MLLGADLKTEGDAEIAAAVAIQPRIAEIMQKYGLAVGG